MSREIYLMINSTQRNSFQSLFSAALDFDPALFNVQGSVIESRIGYSQSTGAQVGALFRTNGLQFIRTTKSGTDTLYQESGPVLALQVLHRRCVAGDVLVTPSLSVVVPRGGRSAPVVLDFRRCFPSEKLEVKA